MDLFAEKHHDLEWSDRFDKPSFIYTYNHDCSLSQDIQYIEFENFEGTFIVLQIHNGADARGGFTEPKVFKLKDYEYFYSWSDGFIGCNNPECNHAYWNTYDGYTWESDETEHLKDHKVKEVETINLDGTQAGFIQVKDKQASCPECSKGLIGG